MIAMLRCHQCGEFRPLAQFPQRNITFAGQAVCRTCRPIPVPPPGPHYNAEQLGRMCRSKDAYTTYEFALAVAAKCSRREVLMRVYRCPACSQWHLTHRADRRVS